MLWTEEDFHLAAKAGEHVKGVGERAGNARRMGDKARPPIGETMEVSFIFDSFESYPDHLPNTTIVQKILIDLIYCYNGVLGNGW
jgi:hypothetical protein